jgi:hypothetical protein
VTTTLHAIPSAEARTAWVGLAPAERDERMEWLEERFAILGPVEIQIMGVPLNNESGLEWIKACREKAPAEWTEQQLLFLTTLWWWDLSQIGFTELNQADLSFSDLYSFLRDKYTVYAELAGCADRRPPESVFDLVRALPDLRSQIEQTRVRCFTINGATWERRERFIPWSEIQVDTIPANVIATLTGHLQMEFPAGGGYKERFSQLVRNLIDRGTNPAEVLVGLAHAGASDPVLRADYAIMTCARGPKLDQPWTLEYEDIFSYVALRPGFEPGAQGIRLKPHQIRNAIAQRMRYNASRRAKQYSAVRTERLLAQPFQFPDIAVMEDAYQNGHQAAGIRFTGRAPFLLEVPVDGKRVTWKGLADIRFNRASYRDEDRFTFNELRLIICYSLWCKTVAETSLELGVHLDKKYGLNLPGQE